MTDTHITAHIPDEAVQAAFEAMNPMKSPSECCLYDVKKGLEAALPYLSAPCAVEVDALAQEIRRVNGKNDLGAGALAELLMPFLSCVVTKPVDVLSASEAVCGLLAWISSRNETVVLGSSHGAAIGAELAAAFCKENNLGYCRDNYHEYLKHPTITAAQPFDVAAVREGDEEKRIDTLRIQAFKTNSNADRQAYFDAASKWFQDRHLRALSPAEPAQAEQSNVSYRMLQQNELIEEDDQFLDDDASTWLRIGKNWIVGLQYSYGLKPARRRITAAPTTEAGQ